MREVALGDPLQQPKDGTIEEWFHDALREIERASYEKEDDETVIEYPVTSVAGLDGDVAANDLKTALSLDNVDNTSDADKPVSTATQTALNLKADASDISNVDNTSDADKPISTATQAALDDKLNVAGGQEITGGFTHAEYDNGTPTNGATITINPSNGLKQKITNNVAGFTIAATAEIGDVELRIINGASAGTITWSGFHRNHPGGDSLTTTNTHEFIAFIYGFGGAGADYIVRSRQ